jgi:hypothetical protein
MREFNHEYIQINLLFYFVFIFFLLLFNSNFIILTREVLSWELESLTYVFDHHNNDVLTCIYRQYDGYISGHGLEIASYLSKFKIVNGLGADNPELKIANGMGCLSAQLIGHLKHGQAGNVYIYQPKLNMDCGQEYEYHIYKDTIKAYAERLWQRKAPNI